MTLRDSGVVLCLLCRGQVVILVSKDGTAAGIVLVQHQRSPGFLILECSMGQGPWSHAEPVYIQEFMETPHID